ncbi:NAD-dependent epimerase/dehydratase family protein [Mucilaginibacter sp. 21P]|uniref:NAD-dependent epimerase/dehydratase family protein n=1 Tax=Mucilaginibacter sp. 21P TaxID=2778902 RepID=UPI001C57BFF8|nr:NAD-dependent epimerase/dehydratase family protein [Mucilaginibacter sp. 21P]QXV66417.1 NAD-dependent epimerase/dehydratase family protein [Mucilaginibacter sp. 21P]
MPDTVKLSVILTGATGLVGEGVLLECLAHPSVEKVLMVNRKHFDLQHPKLQELIVPDFMDLHEVEDILKGYNTCLFCAGISSNGLNEQQYSHITYDITMNFAEALLSENPDMVFNFVSGAHTDSTEKGRMMWARVKGKTENALLKLPFKSVYTFRPGFMKPTDGQKNVKGYYKIISSLYPLLKFLFPSAVLTMKDVSKAMINAAIRGYYKHVLEVKDIKTLAAL